MHDAERGAERRRRHEHGRPAGDGGGGGVEPPPGAQGTRAVAQLGRIEFELADPTAGQRQLSGGFEQAAAFFGAAASQIVTVNVVVDARNTASQRPRISRFGDSSLSVVIRTTFETAGGTGEIRRGSPSGVAIQVAAVCEIGRQPVPAGFVGGIEQGGGAIGEPDRGDGVIEVGHGHLGVEQRAGVDGNGESAEPGGRGHRGEQGGLVPAHAVSLSQGEGDVMRLVAGGLGLSGDAEVADRL